MPAVAAPSSHFLDRAKQSGLVPADLLAKLAAHPGAATAPPTDLAALLVRQGHLSEYQARQLLAGPARWLLAGPYRVVEPLRETAGGTIFRGVEAKSGRAVELTDLRLTAEELAEVRRQTDRVARVAHPHLARVEPLVEAHGRVFAVGEPQVRTDDRGHRPTAEATRLVAQAAAGLSRLHAAGVPLPPVGPGRLTRDAGGAVRLAGVGLPAGDDPADRPYRAPEGGTGPAAAQYALAATLYHLLTGRVPAAGKPLPPPSAGRMDLSAALDKVVGRMAATNPAARYPSLRAAVAALGSWLPPADRDALLDLMAADQPRRRVGTGTAAALLVAVVAGAGLAVAGAVLLTGRPAAPPAVAPSPPPTPGGPLYRCAFAGLADDSLTMSAKGFVSRVGGQQLPAGWSVQVYFPDVTAEFRTGRTDGVSALGVRHAAGRQGGQLWSNFDRRLEAAPADAPLRVRLSYRHDGDGWGAAAVQLNDAPYTRLATADLPPTGGKWATAEIAFRRPAGQKLVFVLEPHNQRHEAASADWLWLREVELTAE